jgi:hypothetical protein
MKPATRALLFFAGSFGTAGAVLFSLLNLAFCAMVNPALPPVERRERYLEKVFVEQAVGFTVCYLMLNGSLFLCVKAVASRARWFERLGLHLLVSSVLAAAVIVLLFVPFLLGFG